MQKVSYKISVNEYLINLAIRENPTVDPEKIKATIGSDDDFQAIYSLYGIRGRFPDRYSLTDYDGKRIDINSINGFQSSILNECFSNFHDPENYPEPFCVLEIKEEDIADGAPHIQIVT